MLTVPSPTGAIQPYPAIGLPFASGIPRRVSSHVSFGARAVPVAPGRDAVRPVAFAGRCRARDRIGCWHRRRRPRSATGSPRSPSAVSSSAPRTKPRSTTGAIASCPIRTDAPVGADPIAEQLVEHVAAQHRAMAGQVGVDSATARSARVRRRSSGHLRPAGRRSASGSTSSRRSSASERGVSTSPHALCRGTGRFSTTVTAVAVPRQPQATAEPAGPLPTTSTSVSSVLTSGRHAVRSDRAVGGGRRRVPAPGRRRRCRSAHLRR